MRSQTLMLLLLMLLSACNLGTQETLEPIETEEPNVDAGSPPLVTIVSPNTGAEFVVGDEVLVSANATDLIGITRMQLLANGQPVKTVGSPSNSNKNMSAVLDYRPSTEGSVTLSVVAYRNNIPSEPATVSVNVRSRQSQITATFAPDPGSNIPVIPNDGVCRALTNTGLNFREGPGTNFSVLSVLPSGTLAPVVGRLGDNSWWKIRVNTTEGWVSAQFTSLYGNCSTVPIAQAPGQPTATPTVTATPQKTNTPTNTPVPGRADLVVTSIVGETDVILPIGQTQVKKTYAITVTNTGLGPSTQFTTKLTVAGTEQEFVLSGLNAGESTLQSIEVAFTGAGSFDLRVVTDADEQITEISEVNNQALLTVKVTAGS